VCDRGGREAARLKRSACPAARHRSGAPAPKRFAVPPRVSVVNHEGEMLADVTEVSAVPAAASSLRIEAIAPHPARGLVRVAFSA
jgi:hypothetical protein